MPNHSICISLVFIFIMLLWYCHPSDSKLQLCCVPQLDEDVRVLLQRFDAEGADEAEQKS